MLCKGFKVDISKFIIIHSDSDGEKENEKSETSESSSAESSSIEDSSSESESESESESKSRKVTKVRGYTFVVMESKYFYSLFPINISWE